MKLLRRLHLYLGVVYAPLLLLFLGTGWYQLANPDRLKSTRDAETWIQKLRVVHTDQIYPSDRPGVISSPKWFRWMSQGLCIALAAATLAGLVLAFRSVRPAWKVWALLFLGCALPAFALWFGNSG